MTRHDAVARADAPALFATSHDEQRRAVVANPLAFSRGSRAADAVARAVAAFLAGLAR
jgi:hypothetical protein